MRRQGFRFVSVLLVLLLSGSAAAGEVTYVYTDVQGTPVMESDAQGNITARYDYRPYGAPVTTASTPQDGPGYTGHVNDADTGLVYMQQRYYDPDVGGFISPDPIRPTPGNIYSFNRYAYANNNPIRYTDPDGRNATAFIGGLFVESWHGITGQGFNGTRLVGALQDGYNGEGAGVLHAALQDVGTLSAVAGVAGAVKGAAALVGRIAAKQAVKEGAELASGASKSLGANPFKGKSAQEVSKVLEKKGYAPKGSDPGAGRGTYVNTKTGRGYHIDAEHPAPKGPHVGVHRSRNMRDTMKPRDYPMGEQ